MVNIYWQYVALGMTLVIKSASGGVVKSENDIQWQKKKNTVLPKVAGKNPTRAPAVLTTCKCRIFGTLFSWPVFRVVMPDSPRQAIPYQPKSGPNSQKSHTILTIGKFHALFETVFQFTCPKSEDRMIVKLLFVFRSTIFDTGTILFVGERNFSKHRTR